MEALDLTLPTPAENLALDEALLETSEAAGGPEWLRFWAADELFAVLGYANHAAREVNLPACRAAGVPVLRRISGGGTVLQGAGCLNYTLVLDSQRDATLTSVAGTNRYILHRHQTALSRLLGTTVALQGATDLCVADRKFSGNSQRRRRRFLLFHGTFLVGLDLALVERFLWPPSIQPAYRQGRRHSDFLTNLALPATALKGTLGLLWEASPASAAPDQAHVARLVEEKYSQPAWSFRF